MERLQNPSARNSRHARSHVLSPICFGAGTHASRVFAVPKSGRGCRSSLALAKYRERKSNGTGMPAATWNQRRRCALRVRSLCVSSSYSTRIAVGAECRLSTRFNRISKRILSDELVAGNLQTTAGSIAANN